MKEVEEKEREELELKRLQEVAKISSIHNTNMKAFERNKSSIVEKEYTVQINRDTFCFTVNSKKCVIFVTISKLCVLTNELFHHVHHMINRTLREKDPEVPELPEERNPIFFVYPICIIISLVLCILWLRFHTFSRTIDVTLVGCTVCILLMLIASISSMRHAEIYINLEEVTDAELLVHPIFIHNFIMCIISILSVVIYLIHFWVLYDCWRWRKKERAEAEGSTPSSRSEEEEPSTSRKIESTIAGNLDPIPEWETLKKKIQEPDQVDVENEPVILYCCCVDIWKYIRERESRISMHEFQVVHVK